MASGCSSGVRVHASARLGDCVRLELCCAGRAASRCPVLCLVWVHCAFGCILNPFPAPPSPSVRLPCVLQVRQLEQERLKKAAAKGYRDRIKDFNEYLAGLSEHHDIPKVGPG